MKTVMLCLVGFFVLSIMAGDATADPKTVCDKWIEAHCSWVDRIVGYHKGQPVKTEHVFICHASIDDLQKSWSACQ
jgi:hypothetical protein